MLIGPGDMRWKFETLLLTFRCCRKVGESWEEAAIYPIVEGRSENATVENSAWPT